MANNNIPWDKIDDKEFEEICLYLAEIEMPDLNMDLYLKKGNKQFGIDIKAFDLSNGKNVCIQCKHTQWNKMSLSVLKKAIKEFKDGKFFPDTKHFIIATSADLQTKPLKNYIDSQSSEFLNEHNIKLEWWDKMNIEKKLRMPYRLVEKYFGIRIAEDHCFLRKKVNKYLYEPVENYIERKILKIDDDNKFDHRRYFFNANSCVDLKQLFTANILLSNKICLIADAYQGKTTLIKQLAHDLSKPDTHIHPILIPIKEHSVVPIESILNNHYSYWKDNPSKELLIILDGLDEVPKDKFLEYVTFINEFSKKYPSISVLFSCRKIFYCHNTIYKNIRGFEFYELYPLQENQIDEYLSKVLRNRKDSFNNYIAKYHLYNFLFDPFFLNNLVNLYKQADLRNNNFPSKLPKNKKEIFNYLIEQSFDSAVDRKLSTGDKLKNEKIKYKLCLKKLALAFQISGTNILTNETVQHYFENPFERELLTHSSVLTFANENWSFNTAFFQENLAALALLEFPFEEIEGLITVGRIYKKVKTKWIQTIASLISFLDAIDPKRNNLIKLIEHDNIELLTYCDASKFDRSFRLEIIGRILKKCIERNSFPILIGANVIADFIKDSPEGLEDCLEKIKSDAPHFIKILCWNIIYYHDNLSYLSIANDLETILLNELYATENNSYCRLLIDTLSKFDLANREIIDNLVLIEKFTNNYECLNSLYQLIIAKKWVDNYYFLGIKGIEYYSIQHNGSLPVLSEKILERFLLDTENTTNLVTLFKAIAKSGWYSFYSTNISLDDKKELLSTLCSKALSVYQEDQSIFYSVAEIIKRQIHHNHNNEYKIFYDFFIKTKTNLKLYKLYFNYDKIDISYDSFIITEDCFEFIYNNFKDGHIAKIDLQQIYNGLTWQNKEIAEQFNNYLIEAEGVELDFLSLVKQKRLENDSIQDAVLSNDLKFIQSRDAFIDGLKLFYNAYGKNKIPKKDCFPWVSDIPKRAKSNSSFFRGFFLRFNTKEIAFNQCIELIDKKNWFNDFRAYEILHYNFHDENAKNVLLNILKEYYDNEIINVDFSTSIKLKGDKVSIDNKATLLIDIYEKYTFDTPLKLLVKMIWFIQYGFNHLKKSDFGNNERLRLSRLIIENVSDKDMLKREIVANIKSGINVDFILSSHLELCRHLGITEAKNIVLKQIGMFKGYDQVYVVEIFMELGGEKFELIPLFMSNSEFNGDLYIKLIELLKDEYENLISASLLNLLDNIDVTDLRKIEYSYLLIELGIKRGFSFLINKLESNSYIPRDVWKIPLLKNINTKFALAEIHKIIHHLLDKYQSPIPNQMHSPSIKEFLLYCLNQLSSKSEEDLSLVEDFLNKSYNELDKTFPNAKDILFHIDRTIEEYRKLDVYSYSILEVKELLAQLK